MKILPCRLPVETFAVSEHTPSRPEIFLPEIFIVGPNMQNNQMLVFLLNFELPAVYTCRKELPLKHVADAAKDKSFVYLLDCMDLDAIHIRSYLDPGNEMTHDATIVLFNLNPDMETDQLAQLQGINGLFYMDDEMRTFLDGLQAIIYGRTFTGKEKAISSKPAWHELSDHPSESLPPLSPREKEILGLISVGLSNRQIAEKIKVSLHTVKTHIYNIYKKIDVPNRLQATLWVTTHLSYEIDSSLPTDTMQ